MMKKITAWLVVFSLLFSIAAPLMDDAEARGRYRSPARTYDPGVPRTPNRTDGINNRAPQRAAPPAAAAPGRGGFGRGVFGGLLGGLMLGGLAGWLFGGILPGLGAFGALLGLVINLLALYVLFLIIRNIVRMFVNRDRHRKDYR